MIDNQLIEEIINSVKASINNKSSITESLSTLNNVLPQKACENLWNYIQNTNQWQSIEDGFYQKNRRKIVWQSDTIIEELHCAFEQVTDAINEQSESVSQHNFIGISLWEDTDGYNIDWHTDNNLLSAAVQVYLFDTCPKQCGTTFQLENSLAELPFVHNTGYLIDQQTNPLVHKTSHPTPAGVKRYSLYASWSFSEKLPG
jgi:hypothetical protein